MHVIEEENMRLDFLNLPDEKMKDMEYALQRGEKDNGLAFTVLRKDYCEAVMPVRPEHLNLYDMVYGGCLFNLMDIVAGVANICGGGLGPTVSGNIEYMSGTRGVKELRCIGLVRRAGRTFSYIDTEVVGDDGRLLCKGSFIYYNKP